MRLIPGLFLAVALLAVGCQKKQAANTETAAGPREAAAALVKKGERSSHFEAVSRHLELGGHLYGYVDVDGDVFKLAAGLTQLADNIAKASPEAAPYLKQDYAAILGDLGVADIKAMGLSSVHDEKGGFRNNVFMYVPSGRRGLLAALGGPAAAYQHVKLAPADADIFAEGEIDLAVVYATLKSVVTRVAGPELAGQLEGQLKTAGASAGISALQVIQSMKGRGVAVLRLEADKVFAIPSAKPLSIPAFSYLLRIDGIGAALEPAISQIPVFEKATEGALTTYTFNQPTPFPGVKPMLAVENGVLYIATSPEFFNECRTGAKSLAQNPAFTKALEQVGGQGNGVAYVSPQLFSRLRQLSGINADAAPEVKQVLGMIVAQLPEVNEPVVSQRINLPEGVLIRSHSFRSMKQDVAMVAIYNPVTIGMMAAMAIPAFQKVRLNSQEKAVQNNLRQLAAAAEQYYLENDVKITSYDRLVGPGKYITSLKAVAGENYRSISFRQGQPLKVKLANGTWVEFKP